MFEPGGTFGRYRILRHVGSGGMGSVHLAVDGLLNRQVALKVLLTEDGSLDAAQRARFVREAKAAAALHHPNVVTVFDVGELEGVPYLAMEYVAGASLRDHVERGDLSIARRFDVLREIASALAAAHERGIVHRDVKPENVIVGAGGKAKVLDFGIAKRSGAVDPGAATAVSRPTEALTAEGAIVGTPAYMAPEQLRGQAVDGRADQFAWGLVAFELLTGHHPWNADSVYGLAAAIIASPAPDLAEMRPDAPPFLAAIVARALAKRPADRFASMTDVLAAWEQGASRPTNTANATEAPRSSSSTKAANELAPATMASAASDSPATMGSAVYRPLEQPALTPQVPSRRAAELAPGAAVPVVKRSRGALAMGAGLLLALVAGGAIATFGRRPGSTPAPVPSATAIATNEAARAPAVSLTSLPRPDSPNAEAVKAYDEGLRALRAADWSKAEERLEHALTLDPELVAAAVTLLAMSPNIPREHGIERFRDLYKRANAGRARLSPRDAALLDAMELTVDREPPDLAGATVRLDEASRRFPEDAGLAFFAGVMNENTDPAAELRDLDRALAIDPGYLDAMQIRARVLDTLGRPDASRAQLDACLAIAPGSECGIDAVLHAARGGECARAEALARSYVLHSAGAVVAYEALAQVLPSRDVPDEEAAEAIRQANAKWSPSVAALREPVALAHLDVLRGRFEAAEKRARELMVAVQRRPDSLAHEVATQLLVEILRERGKDREGALIAQDFLAKRSIWTSGAKLDSATPLLLVVLDRTATVPHAEAMRRMNAWRDEGRLRGRITTRVEVPVLAGQLARTSDEAEALLADIPPTWHVVGASSLAVTVRALVGHLQLLAGRPDAEATLADTTRMCLGLLEPFHWVRAHLWLGQAREAKHDVEGACAAYGEVMAHWGVERPLGPTALEALGRRRSLSCK